MLERDPELEAAVADLPRRERDLGLPAMAGDEHELDGEEPEPPPNADGDGDRHLPEGLWNRLRADPAHAPHYLALAAVDRWGEQARDYGERIRAANPSATNHELAEMVKARHALLARSEGATAGLPGSFAPVAGAAASILPDIGALAWIQTRMVVHIAAVYGHDTTDPEMAAEILVLQGIYSTTEAARVALAAAGKRVAERLVNLYVKGSTLLLLKQLFRYVGIKFTRTAVLKAVPFVSVPVSAAVNEFATRSLANRAMKFYEVGPSNRGG